MLGTCIMGGVSTVNNRENSTTSGRNYTEGTTAHQAKCAVTFSSSALEVGPKRPVDHLRNAHVLSLAGLANSIPPFLVQSHPSRKQPLKQYLRQLGKAEAGLNGMNTAQAGNLVENLG